MKALEIKQVYKKIGNKQILDDISFSIETGEIYGFLGPNGAGKTTTMKAILNLIDIDSGEIKILGKNKLTKLVKKKIGYMPENTYLYKYLTGEEFLRFNGNFFGIPEKKLNKKIDELLEKVGLMKAKKEYLKGYSKGMLQRIGIAQSIIGDPELLFLDEPMSGLDPIGRKLIKDLIVDLRKNGTTILLNSHILADVEEICDKVSIIHKGKIVVESELVSSIEGSLEDYFISKVNF